MQAPVVPLDEANAALPPFVRAESILARGGQGVVYRGTVLGDPAAIKFYTTLPYEMRVDREVDALRMMSCPAITAFLWADGVRIGNDEIRVVATRLVDGAPLDQLLKQRALGNDEIAALVFDATLAVQSLWAKKIVHRDLKPSNIIVERGRGVVIDLGVARHVDQASLTATGTWGTRGYMSPEQSRHVKQLTCRSDLFAIGVIAVQCAMQRHPTNGDQQRLVAGALSNGLPPAAEALALAPLLKRMLELRTTRRPLPEEVLSTLSAYAR